ncbi:hypothetical protein AB0N07_32180 [Streptomyces sp. NPDC051172]
MACGIREDPAVDIEGHVGHYRAGMNRRATVIPVRFLTVTAFGDSPHH